MIVNLHTKVVLYEMHDIHKMRCISGAKLQNSVFRKITHQSFGPKGAENFEE